MQHQLKAGKNSRRLSQSQRIMIVIAVVALVVFYAVFFIFPIGYALTGSFFNWMPTKRVFSFVGLENYRKIFEQSTLGLAMGNTLVFTVVVTLGRTLLGLFFAALIYSMRRGRVLFRTIYFIPVITSTVAVSMVWKWMYEPSNGPLNYYLSLAGHQEQDVQVHSGGDIALDQILQKRHQKQPDRRDCKTYDPVKRAVQPQQGTDGIRIILGDRLVHAEHHGAAHAELRKVQKSQERLEQAVQPQIFGPKIVQHDGTDYKRDKHIDDFQRPVKHNVPRRIPGAFKLHDICCDPFSIGFQGVPCGIRFSGCAGSAIKQISVQCVGLRRDFLPCIFG